MKYFLGIELSENQVKIATFKKLGGKFIVHTLDKLKLDKDFENAKSQILDWRNSKLVNFEESVAVLSIPESSLYLKMMTIPKVKDKQLREAVRWEVSGSTPFPGDDSIIEWIEVERSKNEIKLLAVCTRESTLKEYIAIFENAGINITLAEPSALSFVRSSQDNLEKTTLLMTVEEEETNILIIRRGIPIFTTSINTPLLPEITAKRKLNEKVIEDLAQQAFKTIKFWEEKYQERVLQVIIVGDIANRYYGLANNVNELAGIPAVMATIKDVSGVSFKGEIKTLLLRYIIPIGSFYNFISGDSRVNILPFIRKEETQKKSNQENLLKKSIFLTGLNIIIFLVFLLTFLSLRVLNKSFEGVEDQKRKLISAHPARQHLGWVNEANKITNITDKLFERQKNTGIHFDTFSKLIPEEVMLTKIDMIQAKNEEWVVQGEAKREDILLFYDKLVSEAGAKEITMPYSNLSKPDANDFEIKIIW